MSSTCCWGLAPGWLAPSSPLAPTVCSCCANFFVKSLTRNLPMTKDDYEDEDDDKVAVTGGDMPEVSDAGAKQLRLWSRDWNRGWSVNVTYDLTKGRKKSSSNDAKLFDSLPDEDKLSGTVICLWSDANHDGVIPALDEVKALLPPWAVVSKLSDGLVEVGKDFEI